MKFFIFKLLVKITGLFSDKKNWATDQIERSRQFKACQERQAEMDACVRPRTYPKTKGINARYTDYYDSGENWK